MHFHATQVFQALETPRAGGRARREGAAEGAAQGHREAQGRAERRAALAAWQMLDVRDVLPPVVEGALYRIV